ncbi:HYPOTHETICAL PROTEIN SM_b21442 (plasmid) [Sinorhizobium meliloti 1021]|uniref:Uncharacterized protein n=1 Tax=Rhizobium meliloti (strain 1021) TaxID=266834 RepID=Q92U68_RHIME|nr:HYPOTHETICAL PROTEIN SM_b21442 [Sinorhizobium meliloti 1021]
MKLAINEVQRRGKGHGRAKGYGQRTGRAHQAQSLCDLGAGGTAGRAASAPLGAGGQRNAGTGNAGTGNAGTGNAGTGNAGTGNAERRLRAGERGPGQRQQAARKADRGGGWGTRFARRKSGGSPGRWALSGRHGGLSIPGPPMKRADET